jgi:hypothetical protein
MAPEPYISSKKSYARSGKVRRRNAIFECRAEDFRLPKKGGRIMKITFITNDADAAIAVAVQQSVSGGMRAVVRVAAPDTLWNVISPAPDERDTLMVTSLAVAVDGRLEKPEIVSVPVQAVSPLLPLGPDGDDRLIQLYTEWREILAEIDDPAIYEFDRLALEEREVEIIAAATDLPAAMLAGWRVKACLLRRIIGAEEDDDPVRALASSLADDLTRGMAAP